MSNRAGVSPNRARKREPALGSTKGGLAALILLASTLCAGVASAVGSSHIAKKTKFPAGFAVSILQNDRLIVGKRNRICVASRGDPLTLALVERSGEDIRTWTLASLANDTAIELTQAMRRAGFPVAVTGSGISGRVLLADNPTTEAFCRSQASTIFVSIDIEPSPVAGGYRAIVAARQNGQRFVAQVDRPKLIVMPMEGRAPIPMSATSTPDGERYWDVHHDVFALRRVLINHLFRGG